MENVVDFEDTMARAQLSYRRFCRSEAKLGYSSPIIPGRRWDVQEDGGVVIVTGYSHCQPIFGLTDPVIRYRVTPARAFRIKCGTT